MRKPTYVLLVLCIMLSAGCSWFKSKPKASYQTSKSSIYLESAKVLDSQRLRQGGKMAIIAFSPGEDVEANEELDKVALMVVRGVSDALDGSSLKVVFEDDAKDADFIMEGQITQMSRPSKFKRWVMQKRKMELGLKGRLMDSKTNRTVAVFSDHQKATSSKSDYRQLGFMVGQDIGRFLLSEIEN